MYVGVYRRDWKVLAGASLVSLHENTVELTTSNDAVFRLTSVESEPTAFENTFENSDRCLNNETAQDGSPEAAWSPARQTRSVGRGEDPRTTPPCRCVAR